MKRLPLAQFTSVSYALLVEDPGAFSDRKKIREAIDRQLQLAEAQWNRYLVMIAQSRRTLDTWGTSKSAERSQRALMAAVGGPAPLRKIPKKKAGETPRQ